ncbi:hypothetical protein [Metallibacterium scheffleri]|uniref:Uncharacterized protein n=1 Tax=Metallibacterium scheffleri TaxID=993689 RepID=A0A4S3KS20_9GAMM|nr:hypothetical protein [Metallibacterium scheffleri]THD11268.1 hypothetical protein B1806_03880 [Metallibacterium scheffleri]
MDVDSFSRIDKLLIDTQQVSVEDAQQRRTACRVDLVCGPEVAHSRTLQAAAATVLRMAARCYPGAVTLLASPEVRQALQAAASPAGLPASALATTSARYMIALGTTTCGPQALQVSFDGWTAQVAPGRDSRLAEHEGNPLAGVLAGALAVSETFLHFAGVAAEATHRGVTLSLWQPGKRHADPGPALAYLPSRAWLVGLGHLGQAYAWGYAWLPLAPGPAPELWLADDDKLVDANLETGVLSERNRLGDYKTRIVSAWLEARGIQTRIIERRLGTGVRLEPEEPQLILSGVDRNRARHILAEAGGRLVDAGLGATASNFDTIAVRAFPNPRSAADLWPLDVAASPAAERLAEDNPAYAALSADRCGRVRLAERAVGVPFVGAVAATFAWAQALRDLHGGEHVTDLKLKLASPGDLEAYGRPGIANDLINVPYLPAARAEPHSGA